MVMNADGLLAAKYAASSRRRSSSLAPSDLHSAVHPPVNALGNQAITTGRPASSFRRYVRPSDPGSEKSGAAWPFSDEVSFPPGAAGEKDCRNISATTTTGEVAHAKAYVAQR